MPTSGSMRFRCWRLRAGSPHPEIIARSCAGMEAIREYTSMFNLQYLEQMHGPSAVEQIERRSLVQAHRPTMTGEGTLAAPEDRTSICDRADVKY